jgi:NitT/TauT family transport system permease protein
MNLTYRYQIFMIVIVVIFIILFWQSLGLWPDYPSFLIPLPSQIWSSAWEFSEELMRSTLDTLYSFILAYSVTFIITFGLSILLHGTPFLVRLLMPIFVFFQTVPIIAIAPLLVIWFGLGHTSAIACGVIVSFFPQLNGFVSGYQAHPIELSELYDWLKVNKVTRFVYLELPGAVRSIILSSRSSMGLCLVGVVVGEFIAGTGLGSLIELARAQNRIDVMFAALFLITAIGLTLIGLLKFFEKQLLNYRPFYRF